MQPKVSILVPVYNRETLIGRCIQSALDQTILDIEVVVVDNASTDSTWDICNQFSKKDNRVKVFRNETNIGPVKNWYECLKHASGEYVKILYSDDWLETCYLSETLLAFNSNVSMVASSVNVHMKNEVVRYVNNASIHSSKEVVEGVLTFSNNWCVSPSAWIFRRKDFVDIADVNVVNNFKIDYMSHGMGTDALILLNIVVRYPQVAYVDKVLVHFDCPLDSITGQSDHISYLSNRIVSNAFFVESKRNYLGGKFCSAFNLIALVVLIRCYGVYGVLRYFKLFTNSYPKLRFSFSYVMWKLMMRGSKKSRGEKLGDE